MRYTSAVAGHEINKDFLLEVTRGKKPGYSSIARFGRNTSVANGTWEELSELSTTTTFLSAASTVRIKSGGDAGDTAAGNYAREITVEGLDSSLNRASETIATAGASSSSATTTSFWRVDRAYVSAVGTYGAVNSASITVEDTTGSNSLIQIGDGDAISHKCQYSVPTGYKAYLYNVNMTVDSNQAGDLRIRYRENLNDTSAPMSPIITLQQWDGVKEHTEINDLPFEFPALTDIWMEGRGDGGAADIAATMVFVLVADGA